MPLSDLSLNEMRDAAERAVTVAAAAEVGIFQALGIEGTTPDALAAKLNLDARAVRIILPVLAELGFVENRDDGWALSEKGWQLLGDPASPTYIGGGLGLWLLNLQSWTKLPEVLRTGRPLMDAPVERAPDALARFMAAMAAQPAERVRRVVWRCLKRRPGTRNVLDLGGGPGIYAREFARQGVSVTLFDTAETIEYVREAYDLKASGLKLVSGDFLSDKLPAGPFDIVLLGNICHAYSEDDNRFLLARVREVLPPGGLIAIADFVRGRSWRAAQFALVMLARTAGGDTYSEAEYRNWLQSAGFADIQMDDVDTDRQLVTATRP